MRQKELLFGWLLYQCITREDTFDACDLDLGSNDIVGGRVRVLHFPYEVHRIDFI